MSGNLFEALNTLYSDLQFLFFSMLTLWLVEAFVSRLGEEGGGGKGTVGIGMIYALSLWMTYETRLSGLTVCIVALLGHVVALLCKQLRLNRQNWWLHLILGVKFLSALARWRFHTDVRDFHCGMRSEASRAKRRPAACGPAPAWSSLPR